MIKFWFFYFDILAQFRSIYFKPSIYDFVVEMDYSSGNPEVLDSSLSSEKFT